MLTLGALTFLSPAVLIAGAVLPLIWFLLRLTPPAVRRMAFPATRFLFNLPPTERTSARTPPWLVALRLGLLTLAVLGLADPVLTAHRDEATGPMVVVIDNGWSSAEQWDARQHALRGLLERADRHDRTVALLTTAPSATPGPALRLVPAREALARGNGLQPFPWPTDRKSAADQLASLDIGAGAEAFWISDGVATAGDADFNRALAHIGPVTILRGGPADTPLVLAPPQRSSDNVNQVALPVRRIADDSAPQYILAVRAIDKEDHVLARTAVTLNAGQNITRAVIEAPPELSNRIARFDIEGHAGAATTVLADTHWQRRPVGIASANAGGIAAPLLEDAYYIRQALNADSDVREGDLDTLLSHPLAVLFMASGGRLVNSEVTRLGHWIEGGGVLVRFAGPQLNDNVDPLLPVHLRSGGRSFGGTLSWNEPVHMAPFPANSPFRAMAVPDDVTVASQILAEPASDLPDKTWARLNDGTPLITATRRGQGWLILFHVTATPDWSSLPLSGLFVDLLHRIVDLSAGVETNDANTTTGDLPPLQILDGHGHLIAPDPNAHSLSAKAAEAQAISPSTPPGLYGTTGNFTALNLSPTLARAQPIETWPAGARHVALDGLAHERPLKPYFLTAALVLLLLDLAISFTMRGLPMPNMQGLRHAAGALLGAALLLAASTGNARAAEEHPALPIANGPVVTKPIESDVAAAILETRLAYIVTGDATIDHIAEAGLTALTNVLAGRTSAEMAKPAAVDLTAPAITADRLSPYPFIYWRVAPNQAIPSAKAATALNAYFHRGGMVVFDAPEQAGAIGGKGAAARLEEILRTLDVPALVAVSDDHVVNHSFYLLRGLPGRYADTPVYVDKGTTATDGVASIIVGGNDWAAAWARDAKGLPLYAAIPGGETQREMAYRAGVNMVMYALTGNYKSDQVHLPAIMQRLTQ